MVRGQTGSRRLTCTSIVFPNLIEASLHFHNAVERHCGSDWNEHAYRITLRVFKEGFWNVRPGVVEVEFAFEAMDPRRIEKVHDKAHRVCVVRRDGNDAKLAFFDFNRVEENVQAAARAWAAAAGNDDLAVGIRNGAKAETVLIIRG